MRFNLYSIYISLLQLVLVWQSNFWNKRVSSILNDRLRSRVSSIQTSFPRSVIFFMREIGRETVRRKILEGTRRCTRDKVTEKIRTSFEKLRYFPMALINEANSLGKHEQQGKARRRKFNIWGFFLSIGLDFPDTVPSSRFRRQIAFHVSWTSLLCRVY